MMMASELADLTATALTITDTGFNVTKRAGGGELRVPLGAADEQSLREPLFEAL